MFIKQLAFSLIMNYDTNGLSEVAGLDKAVELFFKLEDELRGGKFDDQ